MYPFGYNFCVQHLHFILFYFFGKSVSCFSSGSCALFTGLINIFFSKTFIKNGPYGTIHTFKNYFVTVFSIFSGIQMDPICF